MAESMRPIMVGGEQLAECVRDTTADCEWSIPSVTSFPRRDEWFRCVVTADCDGVTIEDRRVTSSNPNALPLEGARNAVVHLSLNEAEWLLERLPEAIARVKSLQ